MSFGGKVKTTILLLRPVAVLNIQEKVLLSVMASMYAVYHGPAGLRRIAQRTHHFACLLQASARAAGLNVNVEPVFDTLTLSKVNAPRIHEAAVAKKINLHSMP